MLVAMLVLWVIISVVVVALFNLAKIHVRSTQRPTRTSAISGPSAQASVAGDHRLAVGRSLSLAPPRQPAAAALPPPSIRHSA